jgi:alanine dehydrogenase
MSKLTIGLLREEKYIPETRVAFSPLLCQWLMNKYPGLTILVQPSAIRCFSDEEYLKEGIRVTEDLAAADLLVGIKEIPAEKLLPGRKYIFFSHTIKKQSQNRSMLQAVLEKKISLLDYECLVWENGERILGFGHFAGVVGMHNGFYAWGKRSRRFDLKRAFDCSDYHELVEQYKSITLPPIRIAVTGTGRVAKGVYELLEKLNLRMVTVNEFLHEKFDEPVYVVLSTATLYHRLDGKVFERDYFHHHPEAHATTFGDFLSKTDLLVNAIFWNTKAPSFFSLEDLVKKDFSIQVIADITCDIGGSIPCTIRDSTIENPIYGFDRQSRNEVPPFQPGGVDVMAVANLPNELPRESSEEFGDKLIEYVMEELMQPHSAILERATLVKEGRLTPAFTHLQNWVDGKE